MKAANLLFSSVIPIQHISNIQIYGTKVFAERRVASYKQRLEAMFNRAPALLNIGDKEAWENFRRDLASLVAAQPEFDRRKHSNW